MFVRSKKRHKIIDSDMIHILRRISASYIQMTRLHSGGACSWQCKPSFDTFFINPSLTRNLLFAWVTIPLRLSFYEIDNEPRSFVFPLNQLTFMIDMVLCFFIAKYDKNEKLIYKKSEIAWHYLTSWFLIDFCANIPLTLLSSRFTRNYTSLLRLL